MDDLPSSEPVSSYADELLERLIANLIIAYDELMNIKSFDKFLENTLECAYAIGSFDGTGKVLNAFSKHLRGEQE